MLALATFSATRSSNRSARLAERALLAGLRPVLVPSRLEDPPEKVTFVELRWFRVKGGHAVLQHDDDGIFLVMGVRNVGTGLGVLRGWRVESRLQRSIGEGPPDVDAFRTQTRDIYVPAGATSFWQGAIRDADDPDFADVAASIREREAVTIDLLYGDGEGGQRVISRFAALPAGDDDDWLAIVSRHWNLDREDPR